MANPEITSRVYETIRKLPTTRNPAFLAFRFIVHRSMDLMRAPDGWRRHRTFNVQLDALHHSPSVAQDNKGSIQIAPCNGNRSQTKRLSDLALRKEDVIGLHQLGMKQLIGALSITLEGPS